MKHAGRTRRGLAPTRLLLALAACGGAQRPVPAPDPVRREIERAEDAERARQHDQAAAHYRAAIAVAKTPKQQAWARHEFAETLATWGQLAEATHELDAAAAEVPEDAAIWQDLGILRHKQADDAGALEALGRAKQLAPRDARPRIALAALYWSTGEKPRALAEYKELLDLDLPDRVREKVRWAIGVLEKP
jgi:tetratricopeptide (TPR) repeat protein